MGSKDPIFLVSFTWIPLRSILDLGARKPGNKYIHIYIYIQAARPQGRKRIAQIYIYKNEGRKRPQV